MTALLRIEDLSIEIATAGAPLRAVRGVDLSVGRGETLCVVGESGCGKSLTSLAIMGLLPRAARHIARRMEFDGQDLLGLGEPRMRDLRGNRMAMIFQEPMTSLNPAFTIGNQLREVMRRHQRVSGDEAQSRALDLLDRVGVTAAQRRMSQYPHQLSGGLRQRVMIAMALMCGPDLLIADEPTTALDVTIQAQILHLLAELQRDFGMALMLVTHDLGVVSRIADRVAVMYAGEIVEEGPVEAIFDRPSHPYTQGLLASIPVPGRVKPGSHLGTIPGMVPTLNGHLVGCQFADRCAYSHDRCVSADVPLRSAGSGHDYRCVIAPPGQGGEFAGVDSNGE